MGRVLGAKKLLGWLAVFCSTFFFYFATVVIRLAEGEVDIDVSYFAFFRFVLGFVVVSAIMLISRQPVRPRRYHFLLGRMLANTAAVYCFYKAASLGSVAEANILNMTYPLFVACASWFLFKSQRDWVVAVLVGLAFFGVWLVLNPSAEFAVNWHSLWGLGSGILAAAAIIYLNLCRIDHDSNTILFVLFGLGAIVMYTFFHDDIFWPNGKEFYYLMLCGAPGVIGQYLITFGFRFVTAVEGSVISSSRIMLAALLGPIIIGEPALALLGWCGGLCIFVANVGLAMRKSKK